MDKPDSTIVAIVTLNSNVPHPNMRTPYFQATISPSRVKDDYIRFGDISGDELVGWFELKEIDIHSVLFEYADTASLNLVGQDTGMTQIDRLIGGTIPLSQNLSLVDSQNQEG